MRIFPCLKTGELQLQCLLQPQLRYQVWASRSSSTLSYLLLWWLLTVRDVVVYGCQTSPHLRLASQLSHHHQVSCGGLWASQDFPLPTGVRLLCQAATLLGPALARGLCIVFILVEPFCAPFPSGVARFEEVLAPGGPSNSSATTSATSTPSRPQVAVRHQGPVGASGHLL